MKKDFDKWNAKKKSINAKEERLYFKQAEVWWVHFGVNIGFEMDGKNAEFARPVIILKKFNQYSFLALPLSTTKKLNDYKISVGFVDSKKAVANLSQIRNLDSKRLINKVGYIDKKIFRILKEKASRMNFG